MSKEKQSRGERTRHSAPYKCTKCKKIFFVEEYVEDYDPMGNWDLHRCPDDGSKMEGGCDMTVKEARIRAGMTQKQLSELIGIPTTIIEDLETGRKILTDFGRKAIIYRINCISGGILPSIFDEIFRSRSAESEKGGE